MIPKISHLAVVTQMDSAILTATAGLIGSLAGGASTFAASCLTQRGQLCAQTLVQRSTAREALYTEFIVEASQRVTDAWSRQAESPAAIGCYTRRSNGCGLPRPPRSSAPPKKVIRRIVEAYAEPNRIFDDLRRSLCGGEFRDPIRHFSAELDTLRARTPHVPRVQAYATESNPRP